VDVVDMAMSNHKSQNNGNSLKRENTVSFSSPQEMDGADFFLVTLNQA